LIFSITRYNPPTSLFFVAVRFSIPLVRVHFLPHFYLVDFEYIRISSHAFHTVQASLFLLPDRSSFFHPLLSYPFQSEVPELRFFYTFPALPHSSLRPFDPQERVKGSHLPIQPFHVNVKPLSHSPPSGCSIAPPPLLAPLCPDCRPSQSCSLLFPLVHRIKPHGPSACSLPSYDAQPGTLPLKFAPPSVVLFVLSPRGSDDLGPPI